MNEDMGVAEPPWGMVMNATGQWIFTAFVVVPWLVLGTLAVRIWLRDRQAAPLLFMLGGLSAIVIEPVVDVMGMCFFPVQGQWVGIETFLGRPVPIWMFPVYSWFVGGQAFLVWRQMQSGALTRRRLWRHWLTAWGVNLVLETPGVLMGVYTYFGPQPFNLWGLPLWWPSVNATMPIAAAFAVHKLWPRLVGWRILLIVPLVPMADGLVNGGLAFPVWSALHSSGGHFASYPAAVLSVGLATIAIWVLAGSLPHDDAVDKSSGWGVPASSA